MKSITLHNIDDVLYRKLAEVAADQNLSLNAAAKIAMGDGLGISKRKKVRDLSWLFAQKWSKEEADEFDKAVADNEKIDSQDWV